ncbi:MAG: hypothetical protein SGBAC_003835 [Bacillariaceae sp.]
MSTRSMPRSLMRRSVLGDQGTYELDDDKSRSSKKGRKKSRSGSLVPNSPLGLRERRKPAVRRASLSTIETPPHTNAGRSTVDGNNRIRRVRKPKDNEDAGSEDGSKRSRKSRKSLKSTKGRSRRAVLSSLAGDDDNRSQRSVSRRERIAESKSNAVAAANADIQMQQRVETLQSKIVVLKQEQLDAQSEAMKLNKEKRELKLELQRSQTIVRELRADVREKDLAVKEGGEKSVALEKAVDSQLDKLEDLEEELKRANDEIFTLEDKLQQMELQLVESEAIPDGNGDATEEKESGFEAKRRERQERRLLQKEKELEERERKLQRLQAATPSQNAVGGSSSKSGSNKQLEQDNRMLLKALNREKENSKSKIGAKDLEIRRLTEKIARFLEQQGGDYNAETLMENDLLATQLNEEKQSHADTVKLKDEKIAKLETELRQLRLNGSRPREAETYKNEAQDLRRQLEAAQSRNQLLEDEIDNWKNKNIGLEDELSEVKARINKYRAQAASESIKSNRNNNSSSRMNMSGHNNSSGDMSYNDDDSSRRGIGNLWGRVTTAVKNRELLSSTSNHTSSSNNDIVNRSTFH